MASGVMNLTPWGGPTARAASALHVDAGDIFVPLVPVMGVAIVAILVLAFFLGLRERRRLGVLSLPDGASLHAGYDEDGPKNLPEIEVDHDLRRPRLLWVNAGLTLALMVSLVMGVLPLPVLFMVAFAIALIINYPNLAEQRRRVAQHAGNVLSVVSLIFAAGIFTGILSGTGMVEAMSRSLLAVIPDAFSEPYLAGITALVSLPFTFFMSNDAFYFGVLPILSEAAQGYGISPVEMARASLIGQPVHWQASPLVPSTYLSSALSKRTSMTISGLRSNGRCSVAHHPCDWTAGRRSSCSLVAPDTNCRLDFCSGRQNGPACAGSMAGSASRMIRDNIIDEFGALFCVPSHRSSAQYVAVLAERNFMMPMRDGARMATDTYRPGAKWRRRQRTLSRVDPPHAIRQERPAEDRRVFRAARVSRRCAGHSRTIQVRRKVPEGPAARRYRRL